MKMEEQKTQKSNLFKPVLSILRKHMRRMKKYLHFQTILESQSIFRRSYRYVIRRCLKKKTEKFLNSKIDMKMPLQSTKMEEQNLMI